ncbi:hypothetical protein [Cereibacter sediminicola]|uniref:hypothetical protein n=1 Tax=Cereibacter sediminicola TaxID=2584941 RepID=UPI00119FCD15|nr:hypothetical protein [Cereibacter sediminicola]
MRIGAFLMGMGGAAAAAAGIAIYLGFSGWAVAGLAAATLLIAQMLYLGLILLMVREEKARRSSPDHPASPSDGLLPIGKSQQSGL